MPGREDEDRKMTGIESDGSSAADSSDQTPRMTKSLSLHGSISSAPSDRPKTAPKTASRPSFPTPPLDPSIFKAWHKTGQPVAKASGHELSKTTRGPSYDDLIHPAVKKGAQLSKLVRTPSDYYNENIAERNSTMRASTTSDKPTSDLLETRHTRLVRLKDSQRATIEKMRASQETRFTRNATGVALRSNVNRKADNNGFRLVIQPSSLECSATDKAVWSITERPRARSSMSLRPERVQWVEPKLRPASRMSSSLEKGPRLFLDFDAPTYRLQDPKPDNHLSRRASTVTAQVVHTDSDEDESEIVVRWQAREESPVGRTWLDLTDQPPSLLNSGRTPSDNELKDDPGPVAKALLVSDQILAEQTQSPVIQDPIRVDSAQPSPVEDDVFKEGCGTFAGISSPEKNKQIQSALATAIPGSVPVRQPQYPVPSQLTVDVLLANSVHTQQPVTIRSSTATILQPTARPPQAPPRIASRDFAHQQPRHIRNAGSSPVEPSRRNTRPTRQRSLKPQPTTASIDAIIATKKEAAARALVRLHEVMAIPIPEEPELETDLVRPSSSISHRMARAEQAKNLVPVSSLPLLRQDGALMPFAYERAANGQRTRRRSKRRQCGVERAGRPRADSPTLPVMITT